MLLYTLVLCFDLCWLLPHGCFLYITLLSMVYNTFCGLHNYSLLHYVTLGGIVYPL